MKIHFLGATRTTTGSMYLLEVNSQKVLLECGVSASGMCEAGRVRHHLKNHIGDAKNLVLFIGYCVQHTLGAQIREGRSPVNIFGEPHEVRAKIAAFDSFSGHADRSELIDYVKRLQGNIKKVAVIHGEEEQSMAFAQTLRTLIPNAEVIVPEYQQILEVG